MYTNYYHEHSVFIDSVNRMMAQDLAPHVEKWEREDNFPNSVFKLLGDHGYLGLLISEEYGGSKADYRLAAAWCETFGELRSVGLTIAVNMHALVISHALDRYGSAQAKDRWLKLAVQGNAIGAYAFTEPGAGSDLASLRTSARKDGTRWILNGSKTFITNGARADFILVLARTDPKAGYKGFTTFVVDTSQPGFKVQRKLDKLGWRASDTAELTFDDYVLDESAVLGKVGEGWGQAATNLNWERLMLTLTTLGGARACLKDALRYGRDRQAFGKPIIEQNAVAGMLSEMYAKVVQSEVLTHHALDLLHSNKNCRAEVSVAKRQVCDDAVWLADRAIQIHGGYGYTREFSAERWWRDLRLMPIGGGTSEIMANIVAKELLA